MLGLALEQNGNSNKNQNPFGPQRGLAGGALPEEKRESWPPFCLSLATEPSADLLTSLGSDYSSTTWRYSSLSCWKASSWARCSQETSYCSGIWDPLPSSSTDGRFLVMGLLLCPGIPCTPAGFLSCSKTCQGLPSHHPWRRIQSSHPA